MASIFYTSRVVPLWHPHSVSSSSSGHRHRRAALLWSHCPGGSCVCPRRLSLRACTSSDLGDPERLSAFEGEDYSSSVLHASSGSFQADSASSQTPASSLGDKIEAASQLNESVPSLSLDQIEEGVVEGGGGGGSGDSGSPGGGGGDGKGEGESEDKHKKGMSMSQKLTLAYAMLVGVGGAIGYAKSKSTKSLLAGGVSSLVLFYVSSQLPSNPVFASSLGLGVSVVLLTVMGARYKKSGKVFPAGVVALVSLIMTGGYIHGIMRSHA